MTMYDAILVGGGLQNGLLALALAQRGGQRIALVERGARLGGNHTWCFHAGDVPRAALSWLEPLIVQRWPGYVVRFPDFERWLDEPYAAVTSARLHEVLIRHAAIQPGLELKLGEAVRVVGPRRVELASGQVLEGELVVDARGPEAFEADPDTAYQKFVGHELEVDPHPALLPTLMDACVPQTDGFRFFYLLPLAPDRVLLEDTYFSDSPRLDRAHLGAEILAQAARLGLGVRRVIREETGVLPLPTRRVPAFHAAPGLVHGGYRGGWFHPTTGYSFPLALRLANALASLSPAELEQGLVRLGRERARQQRFCLLLNRMMFDGFRAEERFRALERFYRLPVPTLRRFYSLSLTPADRVRILCGRPPTGFSPRRFMQGRTIASESRGESR
jgi:lycopene beta-cyclase